MSRVTELPAADPAAARTHFEGLMSYETDCWDVHASLGDVQDFVLLDVRAPQSFAPWPAGQEDDWRRRGVEGRRLQSRDSGPNLITSRPDLNLDGCHRPRRESSTKSHVPHNLAAAPAAETMKSFALSKVVSKSARPVRRTGRAR